MEKIFPKFWIELYSLDAYSFLCVNNEVTPLPLGYTYLPLNLAVVWMVFFSLGLFVVRSRVQKKLECVQASSKVIDRHVYGHFTSAKPNELDTEGSYTTESGDAPRKG